MTDFKGIYRTGLLAQIEVLEAARDRWSEDQEAAVEGLRRTAQALRDSAREFGFEELSEVASKVSAASREDLRDVLERLLDELHLTSQGPDRKAGAQDRILVISPSTELLAKVARRKPEADVVPAPSAAEARRALELESVSALVLDLVLPGQDGRRLLAELRSRRSTADVPIAVLTPAKNVRIEAECASLGVSALMVEPVDPDALTEVISALDVNTIEPSQPLHLARPSDLQLTFSKVRSRAALSQQPLTIAVLQVDGLAEIEREHGSWAAFSIQNRVAAQVNRALRKNDLLARWTGGEMVALLVDTSLEGARKALEKAGEVVQEEAIQGPDGPLDLTISAGLAELIEVETLEHAIAEADRFLLRARAKGGNQILDSSTEESATPHSILVLENDELIAFLAKQRLGRAGFEVTHVRSAGEVREVPTPDLWVIDTNLPDASLDELLPELRRRSPAPLLAVIPAGDRGILKSVIELGADDFIVRPFDPLELQIRAQRLLKRSAVCATAN